MNLTLQKMREKLQGIIPDAEIELKAEIADEILKRKREKNAIILGHNYMEPALYHSVPDFTGDSLELCRSARATTADIIVFCGVQFMAETAKILNPQKKVLIPSNKAGCSLAASITAQDVIALKKRFPGVPVVTYVNTTAEVKAQSDICCTSSNAQKIIESLKSDRVIFLPDEYLAKNVARETNKKIIFPTKIPRCDAEPNESRLEYELIGWPGRCEVHEQFTVEDIANIRRQFPDVLVLAHPECSPEVTAASDFSGSTSQMIYFVQSSTSKRYVLLTECSMGDNIQAENRDKEMLRLCSIRCPHMNQITLEDTLKSLTEDRYEVNLDPDLIERARIPIDRMLSA